MTFLSNEKMAVTLENNGLVNGIYLTDGTNGDNLVGEANALHKIGIFVDDELSWNRVLT